MHTSSIPLITLTTALGGLAAAAAERQCEKTTVAILGAGIAGVTAAQALSNNSVHDFILIERNKYLGGRMKHTNFGSKPDGTPYTVELGANWLSGVGGSGPVNPVWRLAAEKYNLTRTLTDWDTVDTYNETGPVDYGSLFDDYYDAADRISAMSHNALERNLQGETGRTALSMAGWKPGTDMAAQAVEWYIWDFDMGVPPEISDYLWTMVSNNATYNIFGDEDWYVSDQRGLNAWLVGEAETFLAPNDPRLRLETVVEKIEYSAEGVTVYNDDGSCIDAEYAICTFSVGVLQNDVVAFKPKLPRWKRLAIESFKMTTFTKIYMQFNETFWDRGVQSRLYADPFTRGHYPAFLSLDEPDIFDGSHIMVGFVVDQESYRIERQSDEETQAEVMEVLRSMFPDVDVPEPTDFFYPRWSQDPTAYGSYTDWPVGVSLERHENLRANVDRLFFSGEAGSVAYWGFMHGAYLDGQEAGERVSRLVHGECIDDTTGTCGEYTHYAVLHGPTPEDEYNPTNGWTVDTLEEY